MLIPYIQVHHKKHTSDKNILSVENYVRENKFSEDDTMYYFEVYEDNNVVVFANFYCFELLQEDIDSGDGKPFQLETAVYVKDVKGGVLFNRLYHLGDNDGWGGYDKKLSHFPVWTKEELYDLGIEGFTDSFPGFPNKYVYSWKDYI